MKPLYFIHRGHFIQHIKLSLKADIQDPRNHDESVLLKGIRFSLPS